MVNSKKMSKSSIAVIVLAIMLALSMILGVTGAWFTGTGNATGVDSSLTFGKLGTITVTSGTLTHTDAAGDAVEDRDVMPGDNLTLSDATVVYTAAAGEEASVYYVFVKGGKYYTDVAMTTEASAAVLLAKDVTLTVDSGAVKYNGVEVTTENAAEFDNNAQEGTISIATSSFEVRFIQSTNMDADDAFTALTEDWDTVKTA